MKAFFQIVVLAVLGSFSVFEAAQANQGLAVVLVDLQPGFYMGTDSPRFTAFMDKQTQLIQWAVKKSVPVLIFQAKIANKTDDRFMDILRGHHYSIAWKETDDGFDVRNGNAALETLRRWKVNTIIVAGLNSGACVKSTAEGALKSGLRVISSSDIAATMAYPPIYPDSKWFPIHENFHGYRKLNEIIRD